MESSISTFYTNSYLPWLEGGDPRTKDWPLSYSVAPTAVLVSFYLLFVWNRHRIHQLCPAIELRPIMVVYNLGLCILSAHMCYELLIPSFIVGYNWVCQPMSTDLKNPYEYRIAKAIWWYFISKFIEFLDTIFFVARGRFRQVTILHVYHHASMPFWWWIGVRFAPGGTAIIGPILNCAVHFVMYAYYALSAAFPHWNFWWKRYITALQLCQFWTVITLTGISLLYGQSCTFSFPIRAALFVYMLSLVILFTNFWRQNYKANNNNNNNNNHAAAAAAKKSN